MNDLLNQIFEKIPKKPFYYLSLSWRLFLNRLSKEKWPWWNEVETGLILGAIPLKNWEHHTRLSQNFFPLSILCLLGDFELIKDGTLFSAVQKEDWNHLGVHVKHIVSEDLIPLSQNDLLEASNYIHQELSAGRSVYVHCKAGKGRSVSAVMAYLIQYKKMTCMEALNFVKSRRAQINPNQKQLKALELFATAQNKGTLIKR